MLLWPMLLWSTRPSSRTRTRTPQVRPRPQVLQRKSDMINIAKHAVYLRLCAAAGRTVQRVAVV